MRFVFAQDRFKTAPPCWVQITLGWQQKFRRGLRASSQTLYESCNSLLKDGSALRETHTHPSSYNSSGRVCEAVVHKVRRRSLHLGSVVVANTTGNRDINVLGLSGSMSWA